MIILASQSKVRAELLRNAGVSFVTASPDFDEAHHKRQAVGHTPAEIASLLARGKARNVSQANPSALVIGADQTLDLDGAVYDKPQDLPAARNQLSALRGRTHQLHSAAACFQDGNELWNITQSAQLTMRPFTDEFLATYIASQGADLLTSVGGYKLERAGVQLFQSISGDYFTILGLPLLPLLDFLRRQGEIPA